MRGACRAYGPRMVVAAFVAPYLLEATARFVSVAAELPDVRLGLITCEPAERIPRTCAGGWPVTGGWTTHSTRASWPGR